MFTYMLVRALFSGDITTLFVAALVALFLVFCIIPLHEFAHSFMAVKLGDNTPKHMGQYTLNPMAHIDPMGAILIALFGIGWGKPTPVNPNNFKNRKVGMALTSFAGPFANLLCAFIFVFLYTCIQHSGLYGTDMGSAIQLFFYYGATMNVFLAVFNLIPIPPLDGFGILQVLIPERYLQWFYRNQHIITWVLLLLIFMGPFRNLISWLSDFVINFFYWLSCLPF